MVFCYKKCSYVLFGSRSRTVLLFNLVYYFAFENDLKIRLENDNYDADRKRYWYELSIVVFLFPDTRTSSKDLKICIWMKELLSF